MSSRGSPKCWPGGGRTSPCCWWKGVARANCLRRLGIDPGGLKNVAVMPNMPDPRKFYAATRLILMPSLTENAGFVAMEAMTNGIPVLASNRGGLPETIGDAAPLIDIPARYTPETRDCPRPRKWNPGWRRSFACGTTRRSTSAWRCGRWPAPAVVGGEPGGDLRRFLRESRPSDASAEGPAAPRPAAAALAGKLTVGAASAVGNRIIPKDPFYETL